MRILVGFLPEQYPEVRCFDEIGDVTYLRYDRDFLLSNVADFDLIVPHLFQAIDAEIIYGAKRLKIIATPSTGLDHIDIESMAKKNIHLISLNDDVEFIKNISSTAELAFMHILAAARKFRELDHRVQVDKSWVNTDIRGRELKGKTLGIIGFGRLGKKVAQYAQAFDMNILAYDINSTETDLKVIYSSLSDLLKNSDYITIHVKLNKETKHLINAKNLKLVKKGAVIVNTSRGAVIDSDAVINAINDGTISYLGLDVCNDEFQSGELPKDPLVVESFSNKRILITPHAGGATQDAHSAVFHKILDLVKNQIHKNSQG